MRTPPAINAHRQSPPLARRLRRLRTEIVLGRPVPVAEGFVSRLLGLAFLDRSSAGAGLLIRRCRSVHTLGMRFALDVHFLDAQLRPLSLRHVPPRRIVRDRRADVVLEIPVR